MAGLTNTVERNRHGAFAMAGLVGGVLVLAVLLIQRLPVELTITKTAPVAPSPAARQPGLFATVLALHPSLPAAHVTILEVFGRFKASLRPEPPLVFHPLVIYVADENGNFVPVR
jgi:hypothetical protein